MKRRQRFKTRMKRKIAKFTGIPTTRSGRKAKIRKLLTCGLITMATFAATTTVIIAAIVSIL